MRSFDHKYDVKVKVRVVEEVVVEQRLEGGKSGLHGYLAVGHRS